jgi:hypothetical protein
MALVVVSENLVAFVDGVAQQAFLPGMNGCVDFLKDLGVCVWLGLENNRQNTDEKGAQTVGRMVCESGGKSTCPQTAVYQLAFCLAAICRDAEEP